MELNGEVFVRELTWRTNGIQIESSLFPAISVTRTRDLTERVALFFNFFPLCLLEAFRFNETKLLENGTLFHIEKVFQSPVWMQQKPLLENLSALLRKTEHGCVSYCYSCYGLLCFFLWVEISFEAPLQIEKKWVLWKNSELVENTDSHQPNIQKQRRVDTFLNSSILLPTIKLKETRFSPKSQQLLWQVQYMRRVKKAKVSCQPLPCFSPAALACRLQHNDGLFVQTLYKFLTSLAILVIDTSVSSQQLSAQFFDVHVACKFHAPVGEVIIARKLKASLLF